MERIEIYDTTLRDGLQREGMSLSVGEQLAIAQRLAAAGVEYIEAGFPASNPKHAEFFDLLAREDLGDSKATAFGMTRRRGMGGRATIPRCAVSPSASLRWSPWSARPGTSTSRRSSGSTGPRTCG